MNVEKILKECHYPRLPKLGNSGVDFECDQCGNEVRIDLRYMFLSELSPHCPICGAGPDHLTYKEFSMKVQKL